MASQIPLAPDASAQHSADDGRTNEVARDVAYRRLVLVNVIFCGLPDAGDRGWVLIDAGVIGTTSMIVDAAEERFGKDARPAAIVMTHGHFDHVGGLEHLAERWDVPVYAHDLEHPYLNGNASYPPADPTADGGLMSFLSPLYPRKPVNVGARLCPLPPDGSVPFLPGWKWIHTPGHTPGHVSFWRQQDRMVIAGDAFIMTKQESAYAVALQSPEMRGPPMYFTQNWEQAKISVEKLAALDPEIAVTGHGQAMRGQEMREALHRLAQEFDQVAVPKRGRYVRHPAWAEDGSAYRDP